MTEPANKPRERPKAIRVMPLGECAYCDKWRHDPMMPSHSASALCESGERNHCSCDVCF